MHRLERGNQELEEDVELLKIAGLLAAKKVRRFRYLVQQKYRYRIKKACKTLGISHSGFYAYRARKPSDRQLENEFLSHKIHEVFEQHSGRYGAKRITYTLKDEGIKVNRKRIVRFMLAMGLYTKGAKRAYKHYNKHHRTVAKAIPTTMRSWNRSIRRWNESLLTMLDSKQRIRRVRHCLVLENCTTTA